MFFLSYYCGVNYYVACQICGKFDYLTLVKEKATHPCSKAMSRMELEADWPPLL